MHSTIRHQSISDQQVHNFAEEFNSKLVPVEWEKVDKKLYAKDQVGKTFEVKGKVTAGGEEFDAVAKVTVNEPVVAPVANNTVTFENVQLEDNFWNPKQKVNAVNSLNKAIAQIEQPSGGEPNFKNAIKKLNGEPYDEFQGFVEAVANQVVDSEAADLDAFMAEAWAADTTKTVKDALVEKIAVIGENLNIRRFEKLQQTTVWLFLTSTVADVSVFLLLLIQMLLMTRSKQH